MTETTGTPTDTLTDREREIHEQRLRDIVEANHWFGMLSIENAPAVHERLKKMLDGRRYTFVAYNTDFGHMSADVRTGQRLDPSGTRDGQALTLSTEPLSDGTPWAHIFAHDTYGVWGIDTTHPTEAEAHDDRWHAKKTGTYLVFDGFGDQGSAKVTIEQYNGYGQKLRWIIATEYVTREERAEQEAATLTAARQLLAAGWQRPESPYSFEKDKARPAFGPAPRIAIDALDDMTTYVRDSWRPLTGQEN